MPSKAVRKSVRKTGRKASRPRPVNSTKASGKQDSARRLQEQLTRQTAELAEARAQQTATAEILNVIANSPANVHGALVLKGLTQPSLPTTCRSRPGNRLSALSTEGPIERPCSEWSGSAHLMISEK